MENQLTDGEGLFRTIFPKKEEKKNEDSTKIDSRPNYIFNSRTK
jgi:hypothetical protein